MSRSFVETGVNWGIIPDDVYMRKIEQTNLVEDPLAYEHYIRGLLSDFRPDAPFLESDQPRGHPDDRGSGFGSKERLALRHSGARSTEDPYLPDGTFLDWEFLERDPRGPMGLPDFNKARQQRMARAPFLKMYNDDDYSVPESGINPEQMRSNIRDSQNQIKDRLMIFDESLDSWHNGGSVKFADRRNIENVDMDGVIKDLADNTVKNRQDAVAILSNNYKGMPRLGTPDHRVKIARYGRTRPIMDMGANNWSNNRNNAFLDHQIPVIMEGQMVNKMLGLLILDMEGQRKNKQVVAQGANYGDSEVNQHHAKSINPEDVFKAFQIGLASVVSSGSKSAHGELAGERANQVNFAIGDVDNRYIMTQSKLNHTVAESMANSNRKMNQAEAQKLQASIVESATRDGLVAMGVNKITKRLNKNANSVNLREGLDSREIEESRSTANYATAKPMENRNLGEVLDFEKFGSYSKGTVKRAANYKNAKNKNVGDNEYDIDMNEFADAPFREVADLATRGRIVQAQRGEAEMGDSVGSVDLGAMR